MSEHLDDARDVLENAEEIYSAEMVANAYDRMAADITERLSDRDPVVVCAMMGGLVTTAELMTRLAFPLELDYLHATRYRGEIAGGDLVWNASPSIVLEDRNVLVIDDILDEGHTLKAILDCLEKQRPESINTAVLVEKNHNRRDPAFHADFTGLSVEDRYVFGCGMDYRGYHRQLPNILALRV